MPTVLYLFMPSFHSIIEQRLDSTLAGQPLVVTKKGIIVDGSPEAVSLGISPTTTLRAAKLAYPQLVTIEANRDYSIYSRQAWDLCTQVTPVLEPISDTEAFLDLTGCGDAADISRRLLKEVQSQLHVTPLIGVGPSKFVAKTAARVLLESKPDGGRILSIAPGENRGFLGPLPVKHLWMLPESLIEKLMELGCRTFQDLRQVPQAQLLLKFGRDGVRLSQLANGIDNQPVKPKYPEKQVTVSYTCPPEVGYLEDTGDIARQLDRSAASISQQLNAQDEVCGEISLALSFQDGRVVRKHKLFSEPLSDAKRIGREFLQLWRQLPHSPVAEFHLGAARLSYRPKPQVNLHYDLQKELQVKNLNKAIAYLAEKIGPNTVKPASDIALPRREKMLYLLEQNLL